MAIAEQNRTYTAGFAPLHLLFDGGPLFKMIGRQNVFLQIAAGELPGFPGVALVQGITLDNRFATTAREADIIRFN